MNISLTIYFERNTVIKYFTFIDTHVSLGSFLRDSRNMKRMSCITSRFEQHEQLNHIENMPIIKYN